MVDKDERAWRNEARLPLRDLERAMAAPANDGEVDDVTGNEAGAEEAFGHQAEPYDPDLPRTAPPRGDAHRDREMTDEQRRFRPSTTGRTGPH
jgi:hypothetical protein